MLTDNEIRGAEPLSKPYKLFDSTGLYLLVNPNNSKWWRWRYRFNGKENSLSLGVYPEIGIIKARERRDAAQELLEKGIDPSQARKGEKAEVAKDQADTFQRVAEEWLEIQRKSKSASTIDKTEWILNSFVYPVLADIPVSEITSPLVLEAVRIPESRGLHETAHKTKGRIGQILRYAAVTGRKATDVTVNLKEALVPARGGHHTAITDPKKLGGLLRAIWMYRGRSLAGEAALKLAPMLFQRPGELRKMEWEELEIADQQWVIPAHKMSHPIGDKPSHIVPLSKQAIEIIESLRKITGYCRFVFPNERGCINPMSDGALLQALVSIGYKDQTTVHGFRATARTILDEVLGMRPEWIDMQLAHAVKDPNGEAYSRMAFLPQRREMMQKWSDYLDELRTKPSAP